MEYVVSSQGNSLLGAEGTEIDQMTVKTFLLRNMIFLVVRQRRLELTTSSHG
jgi:hypothetical protein